MIKPCPFCGDYIVYVEFIKTILVQRNFSRGHGGSYDVLQRPLSESPMSYVRCRQCHCQRHDLSYNEYANRIDDAYESAIPEWYAALPEWIAKVEE